MRTLHSIVHSGSNPSPLIFGPEMFNNSTLYYFHVYYFNHSILNMLCDISQSTTIMPIVHITSLSKQYFSLKMARIDRAETCSRK